VAKQKPKVTAEEKGRRLQFKRRQSGQVGEAGNWRLPGDRSGEGARWGGG